MKRRPSPLSTSHFSGRLTPSATPPAKAPRNDGQSPALAEGIPGGPLNVALVGDKEGNPCWACAVSLNIGSGLSHTTLQITHHIGPDVDAQRDLVLSDLKKAGLLAREFQIEGMGATKDGHNAGGDLYYTDGMIDVGVLKSAQEAAEKPANKK